MQSYLRTGPYPATLTHYHRPCFPTGFKGTPCWAEIMAAALSEQRCVWVTKGPFPNPSHLTAHSVAAAWL